MSMSIHGAWKGRLGPSFSVFGSDALRFEEHIDYTFELWAFHRVEQSESILFSFDHRALTINSLSLCPGLISNLDSTFHSCAQSTAQLLYF